MFLSATLTNEGGLTKPDYHTLNLVKNCVDYIVMSDSECASQKSPFMGDESGDETKKTPQAIVGEPSVSPADADDNKDSNTPQESIDDVNFGVAPRPSMQLTSDEVNIIVYRYLQEAGK